MKEETVSDAALRQFLLGDVDDEERQIIESLFITDALAREKILTAEQDLVEDYLEDALTAGDKEKFLSRYGATAAEQQKLRITKAIKNFAAAGDRVSARSPSTSLWGRLTARLGLKPMFVIPIAATVVIAIVIALVWLNSRTEERNRQAALNQELARLNDPANLRESAPGLVSLTLRPGSARGIEAQAELTKPSDSQTVELRLLWTQKEHYPGYRAIVRRVSSDESLTLPPLGADNDGNMIRLRIPARLLNRGLYQVELTGIAADGFTSATEEYQFTVSS